MKTELCPSCDFPEAVEAVFDDTINYKGQPVRVTGLRRFVCPRCNTEFSDEAQSRYNLVRLQACAGGERRYLAGEEIRAWREDVFLTQRQAARIFGGGPNAFSKYETGEIVQTEAMDNLLWLARHWPGVVTVLAKRRGVEIEQRSRSKCGFLFSYTSSNFEQFMSFHVSSTGVPVLGVTAVKGRSKDESNLTFTHLAANERSYSIEASA